MRTRGVALLLCLLLSPMLGRGAAVSSAAPTPSVIISEFQASNVSTLANNFRQFDDWIELQNVSTQSISLQGWALSDRRDGSKPWFFPATNIPPGALWLVWASGRNLTNAGAPLHTRFKLSSEGDYLALLRPDGSKATEFAPQYPTQLADESFGFLPGITQAVAFASPTPGTPNQLSTNLPGPIISSVSHHLIETNGTEQCVIEAHIDPLLAPIQKVQLGWRFQFQRETNQPMEQVSPGVWSTRIAIPPNTRDTLLRWRVYAEDSAKHLSKHPSAANPRVSSRYLGTLIHPTPIPSKLPVFQLFIPTNQRGRAESEQGARGCLVYDGVFYDNIFIKVRGNTTAGFPKKSHRIEFPHDHPLKHPGSTQPNRATSIMAEFGDPTYLRQYLSFWVQRLAGSAAPYHYPVRVQLNGDFWQLAMHSEVLGEELLERHHLDPNGALYKAIGTLEPDFYSTGGPEKKTRRHENEADYRAFAQGLSSELPPLERQRFLYDQSHLPSVLNYLAAARLTQEDDDIWANMSLYRDSDGTGEWRPIPFDMNVSWGFSFAWGGILANEDSARSHPFFGVSNIGQNQGFNRLYDAVVRGPDTRAMLLRRMRSLMDQIWQPPGTPMDQRIIEREIQSVTNRIWNEAILDRQKWGQSWNLPDNTPPEKALSVAVTQLIEEFIEPRRVHLFKTHSASNLLKPVGISVRRSAGIPDAQPDRMALRFASWQLDPSHPQLDFVSITNANPIAVDISGWRLGDDFKFQFAPGTVIPPSGQLHVARQLASFRPSGVLTNHGRGLLAVGNFKGRTSPNNASRGRVTLRNELDQKVAEQFLTPSQP